MVEPLSKKDVFQVSQGVQNRGKINVVEVGRVKEVAKEAEQMMMLVKGEGKTEALRQANVRAKCAVIIEELFGVLSE